MSHGKNCYLEIFSLGRTHLLGGVWNNPEDQILAVICLSIHRLRSPSFAFLGVPLCLISAHPFPPSRETSHPSITVLPFSFSLPVSGSAAELSMARSLFFLTGENEARKERQGTIIRNSTSYDFFPFIFQMLTKGGICAFWPSMKVKVGCVYRELESVERRITGASTQKGGWRRLADILDSFLFWFEGGKKHC